MFSTSFNVEISFKILTHELRGAETSPWALIKFIFLVGSLFFNIQWSLSV